QHRCRATPPRPTTRSRRHPGPDLNKGDLSGTLYIAAVGGDAERPMSLYRRNARPSAALMLASHFAEVTTRHAVSEALTAVYGPEWPWNSTFERSLPSPRMPGYSPRENLTRVRRREQTTGKVI